MQNSEYHVNDPALTAVTPFADALAAAVARCGNPVCVGLDPRYDQLPELLLTASSGSLPSPGRVGNGGRAAQGDLPDPRAAAYSAFCRGIIDVVAPLVPVVKPQSAFFEELGPAGVAALVDVVRYAQQKGLLVILDAKRGDIGSTAEAYARGMIGRAVSPWGADALTVNPYLGDDSLEPFIAVARERNAGLFILVKTSNPGGAMLQDLIVQGHTLYRRVAEHVEQLSAASVGASGYGLAGAVVGATYPEQISELRAEMPHSWFLVPGFGSQGAGAADVAGAFDSRGLGAVINNSRGIIFAHARREYANRFGPSQWQNAVEAATRDMIDQLRAHVPHPRIS